MKFLAFCRRFRKCIPTPIRVKHAIWIIRDIQNWWGVLLRYSDLISTNSFTVYFRNGIEMEVQDASGILTCIESFVTKEYSVTGDEDLILDFGANIGTFAVFAASVNSKALIYCYEPVSRNFELLVRNIQRNKFSQRIIPFRSGVSDKTETTKIRIAHEGAYHSLFDQNDAGDFEEIEVKSLTAYLSNFPAVDLLKFDCEGAEMTALMAVSGDAMQVVRSLQLEYHLFANVPVETLKLRMVSFGFVVTRHFPAANGISGILHFERRSDQR